MTIALIAGGVLAIIVSYLLRDRPSMRTWIGVAGILVVVAYLYFAHGAISFDTLVAIVGNPREAIPSAGLAAFGLVLLASGLFFGLFERVAPD